MHLFSKTHQSQAHRLPTQDTQLQQTQIQNNKADDWDYGLEKCTMLMDKVSTILTTSQNLELSNLELNKLYHYQSQ